MHTLDFAEESQLRRDIPDSRPGDTVRVDVRVVKGTRTRTQTFQGVVLGRSGSGICENFLVRKISFGVGVERSFLLHSPSIGAITVVTRGGVRRAKLYYLRKLHGKAAKIKERREDNHRWFDVVERLEGARHHVEPLFDWTGFVHKLELPASTGTARLGRSWTDLNEGRKRAWNRHSVRCARQAMGISAVRHGEDQQETPIP